MEMDLVGLIQEIGDETNARRLLENLRWPNGPVCPRCGGEGYALKPKPDSKSPVRPGVYKCRKCRKQFTVTVGTIFEDSHIPISKWFLGIHLMCASKKGMSAHQLHRMLGVSYKSAWFMCHRIRYAMTRPPLVDKLRGIVESDETFIGGRGRGRSGPPKHSPKDWRERKVRVLALVQRDGDARSFVVPRGRVTDQNVSDILRKHVAREARLMTDGAYGYRGVGREFPGHETVDHTKGEYARGDVTTNTVEGYFGLLKRGINGTFHHVGEQHLHRYLSEFDFRWNARKVDDGTRAVMAVHGAEGKRLMFKEPTAE
jgi:transposase-like protein